MKKPLLGLATILSLILAQPVSASYLYLSPVSSNPQVGDKFQIDVRLNTQGEQINAVQANLNYPDNLEVEAIQTNLPILAEQTVSGNQVVLAQGSIAPIQGDLKVASITFQAKSGGQANLNFANTSAVPSYLDSTETLNSTQGVNLNIKASEAGPSATPVASTTPANNSRTLSLVVIWSKIIGWFNS